MMSKKDKSILNTFLKKTIFQKNFALSVLENSENIKFNFIKKKDVLVNKIFYIFKKKGELKSFKLSLNFENINISKFFLIKQEKAIFFDINFFKKNSSKHFFYLTFKSLIINYNYYLNNRLNFFIN